MPFCPNCRYEYRADVSECPDCGEVLVDALPSMDDETFRNVRFVPMPDLPGRVYAEMIKGVLEERGIPCYIRSEGIIDTVGVTGTGPVNRGVKLYVPEDRLEECLDIQHGMLDHI